MREGSQLHFKVICTKPNKLVLLHFILPLCQNHSNINNFVLLPNTEFPRRWIINMTSLTSFGVRIRNQSNGSNPHLKETKIKPGTPNPPPTQPFPLNISKTCDWNVHHKCRSTSLQWAPYSGP